MSESTAISWTDATFNPWAGCVNVSPACDHCYAESETRRYGFAQWGKDASRRRTSVTYWKNLDRWNRDALAKGERKRVFIGSWCDIMEEKPELNAIREDLWPIIERTELLDKLLLTKRPQNFRRFIPKLWMENPLPHVWGMTTVESSDYLWRVKALADTPFAVRGLSCEPLLGSLAALDLTGIHWVIVGGESGANARPMRPEWARELRDKCLDSGVAFHFKQWGENDANLVRIGKKNSGSLLDGVDWKQFPNK